MKKSLHKMKKSLLILSFLLVPFSSYAEDDYGNAQMMAMRAKSLIGHQKTTTPPGHQTDILKARRGGPHMAHQREAGCGGIAIGNVRTFHGDHRKHETTVIIQGHVINTGNDC